jgi:hypothetical protein
MKIDGELILEYRKSGVCGGTGEVYVHMYPRAERIYSGPAAQAIYEHMKRFIRERHAGSGDWFERDTEHGKQWRERGAKPERTYAPIED